MPGIKVPRGEAPRMGYSDGTRWHLRVDGSKASNGVSNKRPREVTRRPAPFVDLIEGPSSHSPQKS
jgi:hypothetical protein